MIEKNALLLVCVMYTKFQSWLRLVLTQASSIEQSGETLYSASVVRQLPTSRLPAPD